MLNVFALKNVKVGFWNPPTFSPVDKENTKQGLYRHCLLDPSQARKDHLDECELFYLGQFDEIRGKFDIVEPEFLCDLKEFFRE